MSNPFKKLRFSLALFAFVCSAGLGAVHAAAAQEPKGHQAAAPDEFVPVDPAELETVSGKNLMLGAYAVIFVVLSGYTAALWRREKRLEKNIALLARRTGVTDTHN